MIPAANSNFSPWLVAKDELQCNHEPIPTRTQKSNGVVCVVLQCQKCGERLREVSKKLYNVDALPTFDESLKARATEQFNLRVNELKEIRFELKQQEIEKFTPRDVIEVYTEAIEDRPDFWDQYTPYLKSQRWHAMRNLVLKRDENLCQSCLSRKATQVHHLSYRLFKQLGYSAAFELVAICHECHSKIHPHTAEAQHEMLSSLYNPYLTGVTRER